MKDDKGSGSVVERALRPVSLLVVFGLLVLVSPRGEAGEEGRAPRSRIYAAATVTPEGGLVAVDPDSGESEIILSRASYGGRLSPDRTRLAYLRDGGLWTIDMRGGAEPLRIADREGTPVWSPDGRSLIVSSPKPSKDDSKGSRFETCRMKADGTAPILLPLPDTEYVEDWSSDGQWLATSSMRHRPDEGREIYLMHLDGTAERRLTRTGDNLHPRFSPDGRHVLFIRREKEKKGLGVWVVGVDGRDPRKVYQMDGTHPEACWSPDGRQLAVSIWGINERGTPTHDPADCRVELMDRDGNHRVVLPLPNVSFVGAPDWR
jgi:Tol biopolymer transport system component